MITSAVLSIREGLEAALIIGVVLGALRRMGHSNLNRALWEGVASAIILSMAAAVLLHAIDAELEGTAEQLYEGITMLLAAGVLTWMIFWMRRQSRSINSRLVSKVSLAANQGSGRAIYLLALIAVLREGIELALYLTASSLAAGVIQTIIGTLTGLIIAGVLGYLIYSATIRLNLQRFFLVTSVILVVFAAGLIGRSVAEFNEAGLIPAVISPIWNLNPLLNDHSTLGTILGTLFGYHGTPSLTEALGYGIYILITVYIFTRPKISKVARAILPG